MVASPDQWERDMLAMLLFGPPERPEDRSRALRRIEAKNREAYRKATENGDSFVVLIDASEPTS